MPHNFYVTITDPARAAFFVKVFRSTTVPVQSPVPVWADLPGLPRTLVYLLALSEIPPESRERLVLHLIERFNDTRESVERELESRGLPIIAENTTGTMRNALRYIG